jgi:exosome complex protein LRP1
MEDDDFPEELRESVKKLEAGLGDLEAGFSGLIKQNREEFYQDLDPLARAKLDLVSLYNVNSLFWILIKTLGHNPQVSDVKNELLRVRSVIARCKEVEDKAKRNRVDQSAARRMVASGLWKPGDDKIKSKDSSQEEQPTNSKLQKKMRDFEESAAPAKKKIRQCDV